MMLVMWRDMLMREYDKYVIGALLDKYERSSLFMETNTKAVGIDFKFTKKNLPVYFDENSIAYEDIHQIMKELEYRKLLTIVWKDPLRQNVIQKVVLNLEELDQAYAYVNRKRKSDINEQCTNFLRDYPYKTDTGKVFGTYIEQRIKAGESVKKYIDVSDLVSLKELLIGLEGVCGNGTECYLRELSIQLFGDSKKLEAMSGKIITIIQTFDCNAEFLKDCADVLAEFNVLKNPSYVMLKGKGILSLGTSRIHLSDFPNGIGINSLDITALSFQLQGITSVVTIENLTSFHRFFQDNTLIVYLAGFHNQARRAMLQQIAQAAGDVTYLHWGDMDAGGFKIYRDLCLKTRLPFQTFRMDKKTLKEYQAYAKDLTPSDVIEIKRLLQDEFFSNHRETLEFMLETGKKLEQEIVLDERNSELD